MIANAYNYAIGKGGQPQELKLLWMIDRFGAETVTGERTLSAAQLNRMMTAENIYTGTKQMYNAQNADTWVKENSKLAEMILRAKELSEHG